jgi:RimJ/RimL family protein N-acetyltransferase
LIEPITTARMVLRAITTDDVDLVVELDRDPEVMRFINGGRPTPRDEAARIVERALGHRWLAFEQDGDAFVGWFGLRPVGARERELGYRMRRPLWGRGLATEGALAMIDTAFTRLDTRRVWAQTMTINTASRAVMERCGMHYVRTFHLEWPEPIEGTEHGDVEYELTRAAWERRRR